MLFSSFEIQWSRAGTPGGIWKDLCQYLIWAGKCPQNLQTEALSIHGLGEDTQEGSQGPTCG